jgi:FkbM family methyltransferase
MTQLVETRYGLMECLDGDSIISKALMLYGEWAQLELDVLAKIVSPGDVVLDVGAFLGTHTLALARMVGEDGTVHSFEPRETIRQLLTANVQRNGLTQVLVQPCALGAAAASVETPALDIEEEQNFGGLAIKEAPTGHAARTERIAVLPLDHFSFERVDLIKIDAEGMEAEVIAGGPRTLAAHRPIVFAECNDLRNGSKTLLGCLDIGYVVYGVLSRAFNSDNYKQVSENIFFNGSEASLLAIPAEKVGSIAQRLDLSCFAQIDSLDALALLLLHKPQYPDEVLTAAPAATVLGLEFPSPLSRRRDAALQQLKAELTELRAHAAQLEARLEAERVEAETVQQLKSALTELRAYIGRLEAEHTEAQTVQQRRAELMVLRSYIARLEAERAAADRVASWNARYIRTSAKYWWERIFRRGSGLPSRP